MIIKFALFLLLPVGVLIGVFLLLGVRALILFLLSVPNKVILFAGLLLIIMLFYGEFFALSRLSK